MASTTGHHGGVWRGSGRPGPASVGRRDIAIVYLSVFRSLGGITRRAILKAAVASLAVPTRGGTQPPAGETLYNGIVLPSPWPPARRSVSTIPQRPPYLAAPPAVINIDIGRQLFVDDFLIEESSLHRRFHQATYHPASPVLAPAREYERRDPYAVTTGTAPSPAAMVFSDGVFYDPAERLFKMWYMAGYQQHTALAVSRDGIAWERPSLGVVPGTNIVSDQRRDSSTVWLDLHEADAAARYKMAGYDLGLKALRLSVSADGVRWREVARSGPCGDRSTCFYNPFRRMWGFSLRADVPNSLYRYRRYTESASFTGAQWAENAPVSWTSADRLDVARTDLKTEPQIYNLDAVAYESVMLGLFTMYRGERPDREKPNDICIAFSRDGFHWSREWREPFIGVSDRQGDWNWANVQSAGGVCLVVGDRLHFYVSGRAGVPGTSLPGECTTGLATLRRDGFASVSDQWPAGQARQVNGSRARLTTRPVRFTGQHVFINARIAGDVRLEVLDATGRVIAPYSYEQSVPVTGDGTRLPVRWRGRESLAELRGEVVRFRFTVSDAHLYAFWVSPSPAGQSRGYLAAGGPGYSRPDDAAGL